jgi:proteasome lid subunit RPN8/RPN11
VLSIVLALLLSTGCGDLCREEALAHYGRLFAEAGYGRLPREKAGFLLRERDGSLTFAPWRGGELARARYDGAIPANAIAVVHTHPKSMSPLPSAGDVSEARRLGLPVLVVAREGITVARPDGSIEAIRGYEWLATAAKTPARASGTGRAPASPRTSLPR